MVKFMYKPISNAKQIGEKRPKTAIRFLVLHWTGNTSKGADADAHYRYLQHADRYGSAHYYVDDKQIIQCIGDSYVAWSVGDNQGYGTALNGCTNYNSISVEMCFNADGNFEKMYYNTVELFKELKRQYPNARACRHWDVSRKDCPHGFINGSEKWFKFLDDISKPVRMQLDLSRNSVGIEVNSVKKKQCVMYMREGNKAVAEVIANIKGIPCYCDNGRDLPNEQHKDYDMIYIGDLGKNRAETAKIALNKFLNANIK